MTTPNMTAAESTKNLRKLVTKVGATFGKANEFAQEAAVAIVRHAMAYNDCSKAADLVSVLPPKLRPLMQQWFMYVSPIGVRFDKESDTFKVRFIKPDNKAYRPYDIELANAQNWWQLAKPKEEKTSEPLGFFDQMEKIDEYLERLKKDGNLAKYSEDDRALIKRGIQALQQAVKIVEERIVNHEDNGFRPAEEVVGAITVAPTPRQAEAA